MSLAVVNPDIHCKAGLSTKKLKPTKAKESTWDKSLASWRLRMSCPDTHAGRGKETLQRQSEIKRLPLVSCWYQRISDRLCWSSNLHTWLYMQPRSSQRSLQRAMWSSSPRHLNQRYWRTNQDIHSACHG